MPTPDELRDGINGLSDIAEGELRKLIAGVTSPGELRRALEDLMPRLVEVYGSGAAAFAADWYDELRDEWSAAGRFTAVPADLPDVDYGPLAVNAAAPMFGAEPDAATALSIAAGMVQKRIADQARLTITTSSIADPGSRGWMRVGVGHCDFCTMLIGRGSVYSEATVDFASHNRCKCQAAPAFAPDQVRDVRQQFVASAKRRSALTRAADNRRVRDWIADNL